MRMIGHGVDIVELENFLPAVKQARESFLRRCYTEEEVTDAGTGPHATARLAARFAAKEAVLKALGMGLTDGVALTEVVVSTDSRGAPHIRVTGRCAEAARIAGVDTFYVSLSHTRRTAIASVVAVGVTGP